MCGNVYDYISWRGDLAFEKDSFNEIDGLIFSIMAYVDYSPINNIFSFDKNEAVTLKNAMENAIQGSKSRSEKSEKFFAEKIQLSFEASKYARFSDVKVFAFQDKYDSETEMQFSSVSFILPDGSLVIAFRGTDDTLVGWKEDLNMSFMDSIPAQKNAEIYAKEVIEACSPEKVFIVGHSKGGNLAVWAAANLPASMKSKIIGVYDNDGPGFSGVFIASENYQSIKEKVYKFVPESSIVGMLLEQDERYKTIGSSKKIFLQHNPLSWYVQGKEFVFLEERSKFGKYSDVITKEWLASMTKDEREEFLKTVFDIVGMENARTIGDITDAGFTGAVEIIKTYYDSEPNKRKIILSILKRLAHEIKEEILDH